MKRTTWVPAVVVVVAVIGGVVALTGADDPTADAQAAPANTARVERGELSAVVSQSGTLTYRARPDGSPFSVINHARGTYTGLPEVGDKVGCGDVLYRVDDKPVLLLCGTVPAYRALHEGDAGRDVRQLNRNLHVRGAGAAFTTRTEQALEALQRRRGARVDGSLALGDAVFLPGAVRIAKVTGQLGGSAAAGCPGAERHLGHAPRAGEPRAVPAGSGQAGRSRADHAAGQHDGDGEGRGLRTRRPGPAGQDGAPRTRPSRPTSASTTPARRAGSTGLRSRWTSPPRAWTTR